MADENTPIVRVTNRKPPTDSVFRSEKLEDVGTLIAQRGESDWVATALRQADVRTVGLNW